MANVKTQRNTGPRTTTDTDFGLIDNRGRAVGARVYTMTTSYTALPDGCGTYCTRPESDIGQVFYALRTDALRGGSTFGPGGNLQEFRTEAEREKAIAKYLKGAAARARKAFGGAK
jgi:hypothetical protein